MTRNTVFVRVAWPVTSVFAGRPRLVSASWRKAAPGTRRRERQTEGRRQGVVSRYAGKAAESNEAGFYGSENGALSDPSTPSGCEIFPKREHRERKPAGMFVTGSLFRAFASAPTFLYLLTIVGHDISFVAFLAVRFFHFIFILFIFSV